MNLILILVSALVVLSSCDKYTEYEKNIPINCYGWKIQDTLSYSVDIQDTTTEYDIIVNVRHRDIFNFMNVYIRIITEFNGIAMKNEVISLPLCDEGGKWYGKCAGDICSQRIMIMKKVKFDKAGEYVFKINHEMRTNDLEGLLDIGLEIKKHKKKEYVREN